MALPILRATTDATMKPDFSVTTCHNESNENPTSIPFGRLQNRKSHTITSRKLYRKKPAGTRPNGTP
ncbi:MAG: hypothetical protein J6X98_08395 [Bacteroidales bacterium]|nr:hypothetical protein [Bacteroidales bacterium]